MMAGVEKSVVDAMAARVALERMLLGSYLDSFTVSSLHVSLRFINSIVSPNASLYVDLNFSCPAEVLDDAAFDGVAAEQDFFKGRASFLSKVHGMIGREVDGIELDSTGRLRLSMVDSSIELTASDDDMETEDSIWKVVMEIAADSHASTGGSICCVPTHSGLRFISDARG